MNSKEKALTLIIVALVLESSIAWFLYFTKPQARTVVTKPKSFYADNVQKAIDKCLELGGIPIIDSWNGYLEECKKYE